MGPENVNIEMNVVFDLVGSGDTLFIEKEIVFHLVGSEEIHLEMVVFDPVGSEKIHHFTVFPVGTLQRPFYQEEVSFPCGDPTTAISLRRVTDTALLLIFAF